MADVYNIMLATATNEIISLPWETLPFSADEIILKVMSQHLQKHIGTTISHLLSTTFRIYCFQFGASYLDKKNTCVKGYPTLPKFTGET